MKREECLSPRKKLKVKIRRIWGWEGGGVFKLSIVNDLVYLTLQNVTVMTKVTRQSEMMTQITQIILGMMS